MNEANVRYIFVYPDPYILQYDITHGICLCLVALAFIWHMNYIVGYFYRHTDSDSDSHNLFNINMYIYIVQQKEY